ncbi:threonine--tRNA ligase, partial [Patescibacteria group bacterium]|nr:threonine--tRNA ligase [Patescibacteria group bacterium]
AADFPKIEAEMKKIITANLPMIKKSLTVAAAKKLFKGNPYKQEWLETIDKPTVYWSGDKFADLCSGPHAESTGKIKAFKLLSVAGAYWHGDEKNKMLIRIYGTAFPTQKELGAYLHNLEEAKKRDHRKLGVYLDLFVISDTIGKGLPLLTPKGTIIKNEILKYERELEFKADFQEVTTPHIAKSELYKKTGHWQHYREVMFSAFGIDDEAYVLKPMNCPHHYMIYASRPRSYKDLPVRLSEPGTCYRYEKSGELSGLIRVRALTIDDSHILMSQDQIETEFKTCIDMVKDMFTAFGLSRFYVRLSLNDPSDAVKYIADDKTWKQAGRTLEKIVKDNHLDYEVGKGEASFYGPKLDFMVHDAIGREWQMSTLQLDLFMAKKLDLTYTDARGQRLHPVILHRGLTGSLERTLGLLIEQYAGAFPVWLAPVQVRILPISDKQNLPAQKIFDQLKTNQIRVELDDRPETLGAKIRDGENQKVPFQIILGDKEVKAKKLSLRQRGKGDLGQMTLSQFTAKITQAIEQKTI